MNIQQLEFATVLERIASEDFSAVFMGYSYSDPDVAYLLFDSSQAGVGLSLNALRDPAMDELILRGRSELDPEARAEVYAELQRYVNDQGLLVPLWFDTYYVGVDKSVVNVSVNPDNALIYYDAFIQE
jgi:peptide/nickel transport system substrate-binding protein